MLRCRLMVRDDTRVTIVTVEVVAQIPLPIPTGPTPEAPWVVTVTADPPGWSSPARAEVAGWLRVAGATDLFGELAVMAAHPNRFRLNTPDPAAAVVVELVSDPPPAPGTVAVGPGPDPGTRVLSWVGRTGATHRVPVPARVGDTLAARFPDRFDTTTGPGTPEGGAPRARVSWSRWVEVVGWDPGTPPGTPPAGPVDLPPDAWRTAPGRWLVPAPAVGELDADRFVWTGTVPAPTRRGRRPLPATPLAEHLIAAVPELVDRLDRTGAALVAWPSGAGRRLLVAAASVSVDDLTPVYVMCPPHHLWVWYRVASMVGLPWAGPAGGPGLSARTPADPVPEDPALVVVDGLDDPRFRRAAATPLGDWDCTDVPRVGVAASWETMVRDRTGLVEAMALLRPGEFPTGGGDPSLRYLDPVRGPEIHATRYRVPLGHLASGGFPHDQVQVVTPDRELARVLTGTDPGDWWEPSEAGPPRGPMSPKVPAVVAVLLAADPAERVAVWCRCERTAAMIRAAAPGRISAVVRWPDEDPRDPGGSVVVVTADGRAAPPLGGFDRVVVVSWPADRQVLDDATGARQPGPPGGPHVTVIHLDHPVEDRAAVRCLGDPAPDQ